ncbi:hypothetical protein BH11BAC5_BH11BAC5_30170 [soil metagenome]
MFKETPLLSVLMTAYNRELYIAEAIESVLNSTCKNFELIIVDDRSNDDTVKIAAAYAAKDLRIKIYLNEKNLGDYANRNKAASYATGKYVKYLDSDDTIYSWGLEYCVDLMEIHPAAGMGIFKASNKVDSSYLSPAEAVRKHFFENTFLNIGPSGTILNRQAFEEIGFFKADYGPASDLYFNIKMAARFPVVILPKEFFYYREHAGQEINNQQAYLINNYRYLRDILKLPDLPIEEHSRARLLTTAKRNFIKDCVKSIWRNKNFKSSIQAYRFSEMELKDVVSAVLNRPT